MPGESDARSNLEAPSRRRWRLPQIEKQNRSVVRDDQAEEAGSVEVADCSGECHDRSDAHCVIVKTRRASNSPVCRARRQRHLTRVASTEIIDRRYWLIPLYPQT